MLDVAPGFDLAQLMTPDSTGIFGPGEGAVRLSEQDCNQIIGGNAGTWAMSLLADKPLVMDEKLLDPPLVGTLVLEFLTAQAVLAFQVPASSVFPVSAVGRVVLVNYTPWKHVDPPVPLLSLIPIDRSALDYYQAAVNHFLTVGNAQYLGPAIRRVLKSGTGNLYRNEAFFFYTKMISLVTGAYQQRYDALHVIPGKPEEVRR